MRNTFLIAAPLFLALAAPARADVMVMPATPAEAPVTTVTVTQTSSVTEITQVPVTPAPAPAPAPALLPRKGQTMTEVAKQFGQPAHKHAPVGGGSPKTPPITRWDYDGYSVFFENSHVIDDVVPSNPPEVHHAEELTPATPK